jgi:thiol-disulfide isomerase/thioredoxin
MMMKRFLPLVVAIAIIGVSSCDKVEPPIYGCLDPIALNYDPNATLDDGHCEYDPTLIRGCTDSTASNFNPAAAVDDCHCRYDSLRTVFVEDYTGAYCPNCPRAAEELHRLQCLYGARIVPIAVHVTETFAAPQNNPDGSFSTDFRTPIGNEYDAAFGVGLFLPAGLINRKQFGGLYGQLVTSWDGQVADILATPADAWLDIHVSYDSTSRNIEAAIDVDALNNLDAASGYRLVVLLSEDSIIDWQLDNLADPDKIEDYVHMHVLREGFTGTWGDAVNGGSTMAAGFTETSTFSLTLSPDFVDHNCNVVAFLFRDDTKEVIQSQFMEVVEGH